MHWLAPGGAGGSLTGPVYSLCFGGDRDESRHICQTGARVFLGCRFVCCGACVRACDACVSARCVGPSRVRPPPDLLHISARYMSMCIRVTLISLSEHRTKHTTQVTLRRPRRAHTACELRDTRGRRGRGDARRTHSARTTQRLNPRLGVRWTAAKLTFEHASFWPAQRKKNGVFISF